MVIIDSSVAFKWLVQEEGREKARVFLQNHIEKKNPILVPSLIFYELTNAWACKGTLTTKQVKAKIEKMKSYDLKTINLDFNILKMAAELAKEYKISAYDAIYIALAQKKKCDFITADRKLVSKVNLPFVKTLQ